MREVGVFESVRGILRRSITFLFGLILIVHLGLLILDVRTTAKNLYQMLLAQVTGFAKMNAQTGDVISLQQNLESISAPVTESFPTEVKIIRMSDRKLVVSTSGESFKPSSWFMYRNESQFTAIPYGEMQLLVSFDYTKIVETIAMRALLSLSLVVGGLLVVSAIITRSTKARLVPIDQISNWLSHLDPETVRRGEVTMPSDVSNSRFLSNGIEKVFHQINGLAKDVASRESERKMAEVAAQVSHDVRSPLSALNMIVGTLRDLPEEKRLIIRNAIQRINDIANQLLQKSKGAHSDTIVFHREPIMLMSLLDSIVSEKRVQYRDRLSVGIQCEQGSGYGLFASVDGSQLARVISNLINNSVESFEGAGQINVHLARAGAMAAISIIDNGKGIPQEVLARLGERGVSHGKESSDSGTGLGIYHARQMVEACGGVFKLDSAPRAGTVASITLPLAEPPWWFVRALRVSAGQTVVSLDDDQTIHQIWSDRFTWALGGRGKIEHHSFSTVETLEHWLVRSVKCDTLFLVDFELLGKSESGLDAIERLGLSDTAILVTSRSDESRVRSRAEKMGVKVLPKSLAPFVPIELIES